MSPTELSVQQLFVLCWNGAMDLLSTSGFRYQQLCLYHGPRHRKESKLNIQVFFLQIGYERNSPVPQPKPSHSDLNHSSTSLTCDQIIQLLISLRFLSCIIASEIKRTSWQFEEKLLYFCDFLKFRVPACSQEEIKWLENGRGCRSGWQEQGTEQHRFLGTLLAGLAASVGQSNRESSPVQQC